MNLQICYGYPPKPRMQSSLYRIFTGKNYQIEPLLGVAMGKRIFRMDLDKIRVKLIIR